MTQTLNESYPGRDYWEKRLSEKWGLHGVGHVSFGSPYNEWLYRVRSRVFLRHLRQLQTRIEGCSALDVGSGTGFWLDAWKRLGIRDLVGSDMTTVAVEKLRKDYPGLSVLELDISEREATRRIDRQFQFISAFDVLYHIMEEERFETAISNISSLLCTGGYFIFTDSFLRSSQTSSAHQVNRTLAKYTELLKASGLVLVRRAPIFVLMQTPVDTKSRSLPFLWKSAMAPVKLVPWIGHLYGALLFPLELLLTRYLDESLSTEIMICRKSQ